MSKINFIFDNMPSLYNSDESSNLYKFLSPIGTALDNFLLDIENVRNSRFVDKATSNDLDRIASIINLKRFLNENDDTFRSRIKSRISSFIGGGTISALKQVVVNYLGVEPIIIEHYLPEEGHPYFDNGILKGFDIINLGGLSITIKSGTGYINGMRITSNDTTINLSSSSTLYIKLNIDGTFSIDTTSTPNSTQVSIATVITTSSIDTITDMRNILNPEEHYITNTASITVQIPFDFTLSKIPLEDVKDILRRTKAAGIALLIKIMETYNEIITINDSCCDCFLMGCSGIGSNNFFGGM
jgi:hypothetical protein